MPTRWAAAKGTAFLPDFISLEALYVILPPHFYFLSVFLQHVLFFMTSLNSLAKLWEDFKDYSRFFPRGQITPFPFILWSVVLQINNFHALSWKCLEQVHFSSESYVGTNVPTSTLQRDKSEGYNLVVCVLLQFICWNLIPIVIVLGGRAFGMWLGPVGGVPHGISDCIKENQGASLLSLPCENTLKAPPTKTRPPPDKEYNSALTLGSTVSQIVSIALLML